MNWKGAKPIQKRVNGMNYTSILMVPSSFGSKLLREISRIEPRLAKSTNYSVKLVKKGGKPLSNLFNKNISPPKCQSWIAPPAVMTQLKGNLCVEQKMWSIWQFVTYVKTKISLIDPNFTQGRIMAELLEPCMNAQMNTLPHTDA